MGNVGLDLCYEMFYQAQKKQPAVLDLLAAASVSRGFEGAIY